MRRLISMLAVVFVALVALAAPAIGRAAATNYEGKTSGGHKISFRLAKGKLKDFATGVPMSCLAIQGGGAPITGAEVLTYGWVKLGLKKYEHSELVRPSLFYGEVTRNVTFTTKRTRNGTVKGAVRVQYQFMIPKYPPGTFSIYSCLGNMEFKARPKRK